jgi:hypothetical protein
MIDRENLAKYQKTFISVQFSILFSILKFNNTKNFKDMFSFIF